MSTAAVNICDFIESLRQKNNKNRNDKKPSKLTPKEMRQSMDFRRRSRERD
jgi:hypothetical protein